MFFISQVGEHDCLFSCLKMMLANYHKDRHYLYLAADLTKSYTYYDVVEIAKSYNTELVGVKIELPNELLKCKKFPIIVTLKKKKGVRHSVLLLKVNKKYVTIYDPSSGKQKMPFESFLFAWNHRAIIVGEYIKTKCPIDFPDFVSKKDKIILPILQIIGSSSLLIGTYFISEKAVFYLPIIFFGLFAIFEILFRKGLIDALKRMDEAIYSYKLEKGESKYFDVYQTIEKYRSIALSIIPSIIYEALVSVAISIILILNDYINLAYVILPIILAVLDVFIYQPFYHSEGVRIAIREQDIDDVQSDEEFKMLSQEIHKDAYRVGLNRSAFTYLEVAVLLTIIVTIMAFSHIVSSVYVLFHLCITLFLKQNFAKILESGNQIEELDKIKAKLYSVIRVTN